MSVILLLQKSAGSDGSDDGISNIGYSDTGVCNSGDEVAISKILPISSILERFSNYHPTLCVKVKIFNKCWMNRLTHCSRINIII